MNGKNGVDGSGKESVQIDEPVSQHGAIALARGRDRLVLDLKAVVDDAQALMREAVDTSAESIAGVPAYFEGRLSAVRGNLQKARNSLEAKARHATAVTGEYVKENPWKVMGYATVASIIVGYLFVTAWKPVTGKTERDGK